MSSGSFAFFKRRWCVIPLMISTILHCVLFYSCIRNIPGRTTMTKQCVQRNIEWMLRVYQMRFSSLACLHAYPSEWGVYGYIYNIQHFILPMSKLNVLYLVGGQNCMQRNSKYIRIAIWVHHPEIIESSILVGKKIINGQWYQCFIHSNFVVRIIFLPAMIYYL